MDNLIVMFDRGAKLDESNEGVLLALSSIITDIKRLDVGLGRYNHEMGFILPSNVEVDEKGNGNVIPFIRIVTSNSNMFFHLAGVDEKKAKLANFVQDLSDLIVRISMLKHKKELLFRINITKDDSYGWTVSVDSLNMYSELIGSENTYETIKKFKFPVTAKGGLEFKDYRFYSEVPYERSNGPLGYSQPGQVQYPYVPSILKEQSFKAKTMVPNPNVGESDGK